ncbi:zinc ribbon domain-containing protein [Candidatus Roizmanbacteria bacterium]|nr:zinc ribbon domain-containing protein [Candidatus Roizmanbacteria bacterium]
METGLWFDIKCPNCGTILPGKESYINSSKTCPECHKSVQFVRACSPQVTTTIETAGTLTECPDCGNLISKQAAFCPKCGAPTENKKIKRNKEAGCLHIFGAFLFLTFLFALLTSKCNQELTKNDPTAAEQLQRQQETAAELQRQQEKKKALVASSMPWIDDITGYCLKYKRAANEIVASAIFRDFESAYHPEQARHVESAQGILTSISTDHGGDDVYIRIKIDNLTFHDQDTDKGQKVYNQATNLTKGQCVQFSGNFRSSGFTELGKICPIDFFGELDNIIPCNNN